MPPSHSIAPGSRVLIRDEEWIVKKIDPTTSGGSAITVIGVSDLVRDREMIFLSELDTDIKIMRPEDTVPVRDESQRYIKTRLYLESLFRQTPPSDEKLSISPGAAIDNNPYQFDPAIAALKNPRQRILLADGVGLGKTVEAGILMSELIKRGRGKRIMVATVKSMLTQFQKEMWARFTIPLVRLDSTGIQRIRSVIPSNANPFYYYDKIIISIDTLKQDIQYRTYLEQSYWDIIVIDECHNVAVRGGGKSQRARLAELLSERSDTLVLLSATPHDGNPETFASLMNMLDPTAIANPKDYTPEDIKGLFIRRFKKDIQGQVRDSFMIRKPAVEINAAATPAEEEAFDALTAIEFKTIDRRRQTGHHLFRITLEKSLFSSPAACAETVGNRIERLTKENEEGSAEDINNLKTLLAKVNNIDKSKFSKYQKLIEMLREKDSPLKWSGHDAKDRLIIFSERIETLNFLKESLSADLGLSEEEVVIFHGGLPDVEQQAIVDEFGKLSSKYRLLLASDVASEGINLHYYSHKLIHFDIPWSLMTFQQRNGRIDRYGQEKEPLIYFMATISANEKIKGDMRILEILVRKGEHANINIGDPSLLLKEYEAEKEEEKITSIIESNTKVEDFEDMLSKAEEAADDFDPLTLLMSGGIAPTTDLKNDLNKMPSLFSSAFEYHTSAIDFIKQNIEKLSSNRHSEKTTFDLVATDDIIERFRHLSPEVRPDDNLFILSTDVDEIKKEFKRCRTEEKTWPKQHLLWDLHPVAEWTSDKIISNFSRNEAPTVYLPRILKPGEIIILLYSVIPNRKSQPVITKWFGLGYINNKFDKVFDLNELITYSKLNTSSVPSFPDYALDAETVKKAIVYSITRAREEVTKIFDENARSIKAKVDEHLKRLERLQTKQLDQLEFDFKTAQQQEVKGRALDKKEARERKIRKIFDSYKAWIEDTLKIENNPYMKIAAIFAGEAQK